MTDDNFSRINQAVHACLERCYLAGHPLAALAAFLLELKARPDWTADDILRVETTVRRMLNLIVQPADEPQTLEDHFLNSDR